MGSPINPNVATNHDDVPPKPQIEIMKSDISEISDYLQDNCRIGDLRTHYDKYRRYVLLNTQDMYTQLVNLYIPLFQAQWPDFKRFMDQFTPPPGVTPQALAARSYVSSWIYDLYFSIRDSVKKLSALAFQQYFAHEEVARSFEYDAFLVRLNATIRPTHIIGCPEDTLYIPLLSNTYNWSLHVANPFSLNNFNFDYVMSTGLIGIMKNRKPWNMSSLVTNTLGRPAWLFDWHSDNRACAWFPHEGNYNMDDVSIAYIIGVACTPNLGLRDTDDWQDFPNGIVPFPVITSSYQRVTPRIFYGAYEVRTLSQRTATISVPNPDAEVTSPAQKKKKKPVRAAQPTTGAPPQSSQDTTLSEITVQTPQLQIVDWCYYTLCVLNMDSHTRSGALRMIVFNK
ncbi:TPA_asm: coat protein [Arceuthobium sichuanense virus 7]|nr:TPA_asm: coat protein [Arceuthobium sichuanense virus 7]